MAYQLNRFDNTPLITVQDGTVDSTLNLKLVGKNWAGYGEIQNENFIYLLESFASGTPPAKAISGQVWYDSGTKKLKFYDGTKFRTTGGAEVSDTAPTNPVTGDFWFDTATDQLKAWSGSDWALIGPQSAGDGGKTQMVSELVKEAGTTTTYPVIKAYVGDTVMAVISETEFNPDSAVFGSFPKIKQGITLRNANATTGVSSGGVNNYFWGTAADSARLGGFPANQYVKTTDSIFTTTVAFGDSGFTVGDAPTPKIKMYVDGANGPVIENLVGSGLTLRITSSGISNNIAKLNIDSMFPGQSESYDLGTNSFKWRDVYAKSVRSATLTGNLVGNSTGIHKGRLIADDDTIAYNASTKTFFGTFNGVLVGSAGATIEGTLNGTVQNSLALNGVAASVLPTNNTIAQRNSTGAINATAFVGPATQADALKISTGVYLEAKITNTGNSIAARDAAGDITARYFVGTATAAQYADLAEKYLADEEYAPGTVVVVGGTAEVTACSMNTQAFGVVSTNPAYMMNSELVGGTYIALKGRVPCKVAGDIKKGDMLTAGNNGYAIKWENNVSRAFAIALEDSAGGFGTIEAIVL
jgi:hypothetical protein